MAPVLVFAKPRDVRVAIGRVVERLQPRGATIGGRLVITTPAAARAPTCARNRVNFSRRAAGLVGGARRSAASPASDGRFFRHTASWKAPCRRCGESSPRWSARGRAGAEARFEQNRAAPCYAAALGLRGAEDVVAPVRLHAQPAASRRTVPKPGAGTGERLARLAGENLAGSD